jgi:hypothetical protein
MPDANFGSLISFADVEAKVLAHYKLWMETWLSARERHVGLPVKTIARPRSYIVKQTFTALPGEEQTPIVIAVSDGFASEPERRGSGEHIALFRFGIAVMCSGSNGASRQLCGHYQAAIVGIALRHPGIDNGNIKMNEFVNLRIEDIEEESVGRSLCSVRMEVVYRVNNFAGERPAPALVTFPPPDPENPQPDDPLVETVHVEVDNYKTNEDLEEVTGA